MKNISQLTIEFIGITEIAYYYFFNQTKQSFFGYEINSFLYILFWFLITIFSFYSYYKQKENDITSKK